jgi:DTW domain-containing protein YfiP
MHYKEYGKSSNTGKLLSFFSPYKCTVDIFGTKSADESLWSICSAGDKMPVVLFPSNDSIPLSNLKQYKKDIILCVIDSTWNQAKAVDKWLPKHLARVHIDDYIEKDSLFLLRKQRSESKVNTLRF